jgi:hypothetical protein
MLDKSENILKDNPTTKKDNPFRPFAPEKEILFNCIDRSLALLPEMYFQHKEMDAAKVTAISEAIDKLLELRKQFIRDYFTMPFVLEASDEKKD